MVCSLGVENTKYMITLLLLISPC